MKIKVESGKVLGLLRQSYNLQYFRKYRNALQSEVSKIYSFLSKRDTSIDLTGRNNEHTKYTEPPLLWQINLLTKFNVKWKNESVYIGMHSSLKCQKYILFYQNGILQLILQGETTNTLNTLSHPSCDRLIFWPNLTSSGKMSQSI